MKMKLLNNNKTGLLLLAAFFAGSINLAAQDSTKKEFVVSVHYNMSDNKMVYLLVNTYFKIGKKPDPVRNVTVNLYLDSVSGNNLIEKLTTNEWGIAKAFLPPGLKTAWESSSEHKFIAVAEKGKDYDETQADATFAKSKITIDTSSDGETKSIIVKVSAMKGTEWVPAKDVEMKVGISRLGSILSAGNDPTYTTDSSGTVTVEFKKDSLPGDEKGNIVLAAKVEDNDQFGNLLVEKLVPWGVSFKPDNNFFNQRTLWSTSNRTPPWLIFMASFMVIAVWGTILYLVGQTLKIKKLSKGVSSS
jgi:hypothetical protein